MGFFSEKSRVKERDAGPWGMSLVVLLLLLPGEWSMWQWFAVFWSFSYFYYLFMEEPLQFSEGSGESIASIFAIKWQRIVHLKTLENNTKIEDRIVLKCFILFNLHKCITYIWENTVISNKKTRILQEPNGKQQIKKKGRKK